MKITKRRLRQIIREEVQERVGGGQSWGEEDSDTLGEDDGSTIKYNADPALKGDQTKLPDKLQKGIIDKAEEETLEEAFLFHKNAGVGFDRNIFRPGSSMFFALFRKARSLYNEGSYVPKSVDEFELLEESEIGDFAVYEGQLVPLDYPIMEGNEEHLNEAEYQGKKVELNKPKRGDGGKSYVYVNSGKKNKDGTIKVKKVSFGSSMADAMGDSEAHRKRRKNYGERHNCSDKDDKTKAGYWSCRATKFFGRDISGWW